jgi:hypothetical protein
VLLDTLEDQESETVRELLADLEIVMKPAPPVKTATAVPSAISALTDSSMLLLTHLELLPVRNATLTA